jgi:hypothetical protein
MAGVKSCRFGEPLETILTLPSDLAFIVTDITGGSSISHSLSQAQYLNN